MLRLALLSLLTLPAAAQVNTVDPHAPADLITQVNALAAACGYRCTVHIPAGDYTVQSGTILIHHNGLSLQGEGRGATVIHYAGLNFLDARLDATTYDPSYLGAGTISGFSVLCTNPQVRCITSGSILNERWMDLSVYGPGGITGSPPPGADAQGFVFQNTHNWTERTIFRDIAVGGFNQNFHFMAPKPGGTDSFGYFLFDGLYTAQSARSHSFTVDQGAGLYNVLGFSMQFNSGGTTDADEVFTINGAFTGTGFHVTGENAGARITFAHIGCGGALTFSGDYNIFFGGIVTDCRQGPDHHAEPFRVSPYAGLGGIQYSLGGLAQVPAFNFLGQASPQTLNLWPSDAFNRQNPYTNAYQGFVGTAGGRVSPITVYDPDVPWCVATRTPYTQPGQITPRLCLDGAGNLTTTGDLHTPALITTHPTPATSHEACTLGESWDDDNFHYHCTSTGQLKRSPLAPF